MEPGQKGLTEGTDCRLLTGAWYAVSKNIANDPETVLTETCGSLPFKTIKPFTDWIHCE